MDDILTDVQTAAMVLGFPVLGVIVILIAWFGARVFRDIKKNYDEMRYERWQRRNAERDLDNIEASWVLEPYEDDESSIPYPRAENEDFDWYHRGDTVVLPETLEQLYNYQETEHERS